MKKTEMIDITIPIKDGMVHWPGDPSISIEPVSSIAKGDTANCSLLRMGSHTGTHMDGPFHFLEDGMTLDQMPLEATIGPARVIEILDTPFIGSSELAGHGISRGDRILFKTSNSERCWNTDDFQKDFVSISPDGADFLVESGVSTIGVDYLSVGAYKGQGKYVHRRLLEAGIWIIEGLNLAKAAPGNYILFCLPLKILNSDGAPARAVLQKI